MYNRKINMLSWKAIQLWSAENVWGGEDANGGLQAPMNDRRAVGAHRRPGAGTRSVPLRRPPLACERYAGVRLCCRRGNEVGESGC